MQLQLMTIGDVCERTRISRTTVWRFRTRYSDFPTPIYLDGKHPRWIAQEIDDWLLTRRELRQ